MDLYLCFPDPQTADDVLQDYTGAIDIIGVIHKPTGKMITTLGGKIPELAPIPGWHVNIRGVETEELLKYAVEVATPHRVWA